MLPYTFVHFGGFLCIKDAGRRGNKITVLIFFIIMFDHCFASTCKISHERHKWNTFHIHVLNSTTNLTFVNHTFDCESEVVVLIGKSHDLNRVTYKNGFKREHFCQRALIPFMVKIGFYHLLHFVSAFWLVMTFLLTFLSFEDIVIITETCSKISNIKNINNEPVLTHEQIFQLNRHHQTHLIPLQEPAELLVDMVKWNYCLHETEMQNKGVASNKPSLKLIRNLC